MAQLTVAFTPHPVNGWFLKLAADPFIIIDGVQHACHWGEPITLTVSAGRHHLAPAIRYKRFIRGNLPSKPLTLTFADDDAVHLTARNGLRNDAPFELREE